MDDGWRDGQFRACDGTLAKKEESTVTGGTRRARCSGPPSPAAAADDDGGRISSQQTRDQERERCGSGGRHRRFKIFFFLIPLLQSRFSFMSCLRHNLHSLLVVILSPAVAATQKKYYPFFMSSPLFGRSLFGLRATININQPRTAPNRPR